MLDVLPVKNEAALLRKDEDDAAAAAAGPAADTSAVGLIAGGLVVASIDSELRLSRKPISPSAIHIELRALLRRSSSSMPSLLAVAACCISVELVT